MGLALTLHLLGQAMWIGGGLAAMVLAVGSRGEDPAVRGAVFRLLARVHGQIIAPGALLTALTGLWLTMSLARGGTAGSPGGAGLAVMQGAGLVAALLVLFIALPTANQLAVVATPDASGQLPPSFERLRKRQAIMSSVAGALVLLALAGARLF